LPTTSAPTPPIASTTKLMPTIISGPSSVQRGSGTSITVQGNPMTFYVILVTYYSGTTADGLYAKVPDIDGKVSWTWIVGGDTPTGTATITIYESGVPSVTLTHYFTVTSS